ncbi:hypothetical protein HanRHA438_Chr01g0030911 [Helianthus annuus]|nr:hypothetical protein HanIR_Chr01g0033261 [Helianthus annuus]KAJ0948726.1 hypothetical protein HanRHA438_Chr01g0030911 [Helianthus annuus]
MSLTFRVWLRNGGRRRPNMGLLRQRSLYSASMGSCEPLKYSGSEALRVIFKIYSPNSAVKGDFVRATTVLQVPVCLEKR